MENPIDEYNAGKEGTGSMNGRKINHAATGTRLNRSAGDRGRDPAHYPPPRPCLPPVLSI